MKNMTTYLIENIEMCGRCKITFIGLIIDVNLRILHL